MLEPAPQLLSGFLQKQKLQVFTVVKTWLRGARLSPADRVESKDKRNQQGAIRIQAKSAGLRLLSQIVANLSEKVASSIFTMKMELTGSFEMLVNIFKIKSLTFQKIL